MTAYLVKRALFAIPVLLLTALLVFSALHLAGGDPVMLLVPATAPQHVRDAVRAKLGLDQPLPIQFVKYMSHALRGDLGQSILSRRPVSELILEFWLGLMLMYFFSAQLKWLPPTGHGGLKYLILPTLALALPRVGRIARITRSSLLEVIGQDYIRTARAKGLAERATVMRHALRNALIPIISLMGLDLGYIIGGSVVIEAVFARPGIGDMMLRAIYSRDFPVLQGCMFVLTLAIILSNILADLTYAVVDPRIRH